LVYRALAVAAAGRDRSRYASTANVCPLKWGRQDLQQAAAYTAGGTRGATASWRRDRTGRKLSAFLKSLAARSSPPWKLAYELSTVHVVERSQRRCYVGNVKSGYLFRPAHVTALFFILGE
jgi:hypothetical protein